MNINHLFANNTNEVIKMDKKFITAVVVCFVALTAIATGTFFIGKQADRNNIKLQKTAEVTTVEIIDIDAAGQVEQTPPDRVYDPEFASEEVTTEDETTEKETHKPVEKNTVSNVSDDEYLYGLSSEAAAEIDKLEFGKKSKLLWPVQGNILIPFNLENTVYYKTLDEYRISKGLVISSKKGTAVKAAADGVITLISDDEELGVYINEAVGDKYIATYGQITNPEVAQGDFVEAGQTIGYINTPTDYYKLEGPNLYFALAKDGKPVDPLKFIKIDG